jgi:23S rRNA (pseudouridine1915-N3)-methyltransferase
MRIDIVAVGRLKSGPEAALYARYAERIGGAARPLGLSGPKLVEIAESGARREADRRVEEGRAILAQFAPGGAMLAFDERGAMLDSAAFAARIARCRDEGRRSASFVIGGPDGLSDEVRSRADALISFGAMTMPHQIVRILLAEQIYRAMTILSGHPYHRA